MKSKTHLINKLIQQEKTLFKQGVYRSQQQSKAQIQISKMTRLLRDYDAQNKFLTKKVQQLIGQNYKLKIQKSKGKPRPSSPPFKSEQQPKQIHLNKNQFNQLAQTQAIITYDSPSQKSVKNSVKQLNFSLHLQSPKKTLNSKLSQQDDNQFSSSLLISPKQKLFNPEVIGDQITFKSINKKKSFNIKNMGINEKQSQAENKQDSEPNYQINRTGKFNNPADQMNKQLRKTFNSRQNLVFRDKQFKSSKKRFLTLVSRRQF